MAIADTSLRPARSLRQSLLVRFCRAQPLGAVSLVVIVAMMAAGLFAEWAAPYDPVELDFGGMLVPPSLEHLCGTDAFGRDVFSRIIYGARTALTIGFLSSFSGSTLGAVLGATSAYFGGRIDSLIQRFIDIMLAFPIIVLALVVVTVLGRSRVLGVDLNLILAIAIPIVPNVTRVVRDLKSVV